jgi:NADPH-dependent 2,4-dienoyl-CoA reductase/sulfur reductase-like enzyme
MKKEGSAISTVTVVGAGPAGLAAALAAADLGCAVTLVDSAPAPGGQIYRQSLIPAPRKSKSRDSARLPPHLHRALRHERVRYVPGVCVWHAERTGGGEGEFVLRLAGLDGACARAPASPRSGAVRSRAVIVATGSTELVLPFPGWDLPGVTTVGAAQALLKSQGVTIGRRAVVAGSGPLLLPAAAGLAAAGVRVLAVLEATTAGAGARGAAGLAAYPAKLAEAFGYTATLAMHRVPVRLGHAVVGCRGEDSGEGRVRRATIARLDRDWRPVPGSHREVEVDALHVSFGFSPALELTRLLGCADEPHPARPVAAVRTDACQATSVPGVFAAGEVTGVGGAEAAELEGYLAGAAAARYAGGLTGAGRAPRLEAIRARLARAHRFAARLDAAYPFRPGWLGWPAPDTIVCRCEDVRWAEIGRAVASGARDVRAVKGLTRCGMGYCQGRVCGPTVQYAVSQISGRPLARVGDLHSRSLLTPVSLDVLTDTP